MHTLRRNSGSVLALSAAFAFALMLLGLGFFVVTMYFGGERETKNAADAGTLNVGRKATTVMVPLQAGDEQQFSDVSESGQASLKSINRIWGKALLAAVNAAQMTNEGTIGSGQADAQSLHDAAQSISDRLAAALSAPNSLTQFQTFYLAFAQANSVRMLGKNSSVSMGDASGWKTAFTDRGFESNVQVAAAQMPVNYNINSLNPVTNFKDPGNKYLPGYSPLQVAGMTFWQVPDRYSERPHLIAQSVFGQNNDPTTLGPPSWTNAVPNSFSTLGATINNQGYAEKASSWVETNPQQTYQLAMPAGYIRVVIQANTLQWNVDGIDMDSENYNFFPDSSTSIPYPLPCGAISGTELTGLEYTGGPNLFTAIFAQPPAPPSQSTTFDYLFQRVQEIHPGYDKNKFISQLNGTFINPTATSDQEYDIYQPSGNPSADMVICLSAAAPSWVNSQPDGTEQTLETEGPDGPNQGMTELDCYGTWDYPSYSQFDGERKWTPGTGYNGCLGKLTIHRTTTAYLFGICSCP